MDNGSLRLFVVVDAGRGAWRIAGRMLDNDTVAGIIRKRADGGRSSMMTRIQARGGR